jgi:hypothetical protein
MRILRSLSFGFAGLLVCASVQAADGPFIGSTGTLSTIEYGVSGTAVVVDAQTIRVDHFYYQGGGISVFFRLGTNDTSAAFNSGITLGDQLVGHSFADATVTLNLPSGQSVEGYHALSVYCVDAQVDFGSGTFVDPVPPHLDSIERTNGATAVVLSGQLGRAYQLQSSSNLMSWEDLDLETNTAGTLTFTDTNQVEPHFYRAVVR